MPLRLQTRLVRCCRRTLLWGFGSAVVLAILVASGLFYLHWAGVPSFVQQGLEAALQARGIQLHLGEAHLRGSHLLAHNVAVTATAPLGSAHGTINGVDLHLDWKALLTGRFGLRSFTLQGGRIEWVQSSANGVPRRLAVTDLDTELHFLPEEQWELTRCTGRLLGAEVRISASITNAPALRQWTFRRPGPHKTDWQNQIDRLLQGLEGFTCESSVLDVHISGDGRDPDSLQTELELQAPKAAWAQTSLENLHLRATARPAKDLPGASALDVHLAAGRASGPWGELNALNLTAQGAGSLTNQILQKVQWQLRLASFHCFSVTGETLSASATTVPSRNAETPFHTEIEARAATLQTPWSDSAQNRLSLAASHGLTRTALWELDWNAAAGPARSRWGEVRHAQFSGSGAPRLPFTAWQLPDASWGVWQKLEPFELSWNCEVEGLRSPKLQVERATCAGEWQAPEMTLLDVYTELYGGHAQCSGRLDVVTREVESNAALNFDVHEISALLTPESQRWLSQFTWQVPPQVSAAMRVLLPAWTNTRPQWREEVMPTIELAGQFAGSNGSFRSVPVAYARSHFTLTNLMWHLPDLLVRRPDTEGLLEYTGSMATHDYRWRIDVRADPRAFRPLLTEDGVLRVLEQFDFGVPPAVQGEIWGRWHEPDMIGFSGRLAATNFTFRGELVTELQSAVALTNAVLHFSDTVVRHNAQEITVPSGSFDLTERVVYVTNAVSTMDPDLVTRVIGPKVRAAVAPYRFDKPPTVRISGRLPTFDTQDADVRFAVAGEAFHYWKLQAPSLTGDVHWRGDSLLITNVQASFYGGDLNWHGQFDFSVPVGATLAFEGSFKNADLHAFAADLGKKTNNLQGSVDGRLAITGANSDDWRSWEGAGHVRLRDGFLWDIPIFGFFSPVLNTIVPGLGNSPISAGDASFTIDQSVVHTGDLELKSPALRLRYSGNVDFKGGVNARMQADILRDAWGVGRILSVALWPVSKAFEYQIKGSVYHPKSEPVYIPKVLLWALHPLKTVRKVFGAEKPADTEEKW